tara:strand:- start:1593 stop:2165 length:573 start_codon:yes stop_codon:yes gene_type:complete
MTKPNQYVFESELTGFINVYQDSGKYENRTFSYTLPAKVIKQVEKDRKELLKWVDSKLEKPDRVALNPEPYDEEGLCKYSYSDTDKKPIPVFVDTEGSPLSDSDLQSLRKGTKAVLIVNQTPYTKPAKGTSLKVVGVQVTKLVTMNGASDSGDMSVEDVNAIFGTRDGYKASSPTVSAPAADTSAESYDF